MHPKLCYKQSILIQETNNNDDDRQLLITSSLPNQQRKKAHYYVLTMHERDTRFLVIKGSKTHSTLHKHKPKYL